jgi:hypothetical protein
MDTTANHMTIAACPEGGFMVYSHHEQERAFVRNSHMIPIAGFSDLKAALAFIEQKMTPPDADRARRLSTPIPGGTI